MFWDKMQKINKYYIYALLVIALVIPMFVPLGLPISITADTRKVYDLMEKIPPGSPILMSFDYTANAVAEMDPMATALLKQAFKRGLKVVLFSQGDQGAVLAQKIGDDLAGKMKKNYGTDYVHLGYKPGGTVVLRRMVEDLWDAAANVDMNGKPLSSFPLMQNIKKITDVKAIVVISNGSPGFVEWLNYVTGPQKMPLFGGTVSVMVPGYMPYVQSGQFAGLLQGSRGTAEYELLIKEPGKAVSAQDSQSLSHLYLVTLLVLGNLGYFLRKKPADGR
ncbi:MAG: hypothetical protein M1299_09805 [Firmicutes bacterium]|nr:hypothetical protein [Bacillota bacterium]MCL5040099.1 hypothetical protein [Bacillota bacterium]